MYHLSIMQIDGLEEKGHFVILHRAYIGNETKETTRFLLALFSLSTHLFRRHVLFALLFHQILEKSILVTSDVAAKENKIQFKMH